MANQNVNEEHPGQPASAPVMPGVQVMEVAQTHAPTSNDPAPEPSPSKLQDVFPEITRLAQRVGGLDKLAEIIQTLRGVRT